MAGNLVPKDLTDQVALRGFLQSLEASVREAGGLTIAKVTNLSLISNLFESEVSHSELTLVSDKVIRIRVWDTELKDLELFDTLLKYTSDKLTTITTNDIQLSSQVVKTITYDGDSVSTITVV